MALAYEGNTDLAFDTEILREYGNKYGDIAENLRTLAKDLDNCLTDLSKDGWTTPAGKEFLSMTQINWEENIDKYADLLDTLKDILNQAAGKYEDLAVNHIEKTKL